MDEMIEEIQRDLSSAMERVDMSASELAKLCDVTPSSIYGWSKHGVPDGRLYQVAHFIGQRDLAQTSGNDISRIIQALRWYAEPEHYQRDARPKTGPKFDQTPEITVYRRAVLRDRGAIARMVLKGVEQC